LVSAGRNENKKSPAQKHEGRSKNSAVPPCIQAKAYLISAIRAPTRSACGKGHSQSAPGRCAQNCRRRALSADDARSLSPGERLVPSPSKRLLSFHITTLYIRLMIIATKTKNNFPKSHRNPVEKIIKNLYCEIVNENNKIS
jgi:hypothetical protein